MKKIAFTLLALIPLLLSAQSFILRAGNEVYQYDKTQKRWSSNPLPIGTPLKKNDYIKSKTKFTLEVVPDEWYKEYNPFYINSCYTYIAYPNGVRLDSKLTEFNNTADRIPESKVTQGASDDKAFLSHLSWAYCECTKKTISCFEDSSSSVDVILASSNRLLDSISISDSLRITLINKNDYNVFIYILWKDNKWMLWDWDVKNNLGIRLSDLSCYSQTIKFDKYTGEQNLFFIFSKEELNGNLLKSFSSEIVPKYDEHYSQPQGYSYIVKRIITTY